jgi:nucleoside-diphosphate-sugar epimerase
MNVLVTGATGFVGSAVVRSLLRRGHAVLGLVREAARRHALEELGAATAVGDMERPDTYEPLVSRVDAVVHAAQAKPRGRWTHRRIQAMHHSDAVMTRALARACLDQGKVLIYTSGAMAHADGRDDWISEATPLRPCLLAKGHAEIVAELASLHRDRGLRAQVITPGFVYGPGGLLQETVELLLRRRYRVIGSGANYWGLVHVGDLGEIYALALERGSPGDNYFVCDDLPMRRRDVIDRVTDALGLPRVGSVPGWMVGLWLGFAAVEAINASIRMRNDFVKRRLGWSPRYRSFAEGLPSVLEQLRAGSANQRAI